jgi:hypothetical protein
MQRGSRKHVLDWVESVGFPADLVRLLSPVPSVITESSPWMPKGHSCSQEAELHRFGPKVLPDACDWDELHSWWLEHKRGARTPNWDLAVQCEIRGESGLILLEAKAHEGELERVGKPQKKEDRVHTRENRHRISAAIAQARRGYAVLGHELSIDVGSHYQLSNRLSYAWKLASLGVPVALVYLGFVGDRPWEDSIVPFRSEAHWSSCVRDYFGEVGATGILNTTLDVGGTQFWVLARHRDVLERSPGGGLSG